MNDYLWDGTGEPEPEVERLEKLLARYRGPQGALSPLHAIPVRAAWFQQTRFQPPVYAAAAIAATVVIALALMLLRPAAPAPETGMRFAAVTGAPRLNGIATASGALQLGQRLETGVSDAANVRVADIGWVEIGPGSVVALLENREGRRRLRLERGVLHAEIAAPPAVFVVETPSARVIDLGCAYTLTLSPAGEGEIQVTAGWVQMDFGYVQSLVPAGFAARIAPGGRISPPYTQQTSPEFRDALLTWWRAEGPAAAPRLRETALSEILARAQKRDALTLLNMFGWAEEDERGRVYDRLDALVRAPAGVTRAEIVAGTRNAAGPWWPVVHQELGVSTFKKKGPLHLGRYFGEQ
ncbi:MAG: FecR domain-containing protein [Acidobacteriota bacterium]|nr:FecR domain-containing protein [Acidobacteriota bacterium]